MAQQMSGKVCIVTGATRGIGKGVALQLGGAGATVYITGRTLKPRQDSVGGSLQETAQEIRDRGGRCIPVQCDHSKDADIKALFDRVNHEQNGQLDVLVNNAFSGMMKVIENMGKSFWESDVTFWDDINKVALRNHYYCAVYGARLMVPRKQGLIVNISSIGGLSYLFNVPLGVGKEACDRMAVDCAVELRKHKVAFVSLWLGAVQTEFFLDAVDKGTFRDAPKVGDMFIQGESKEFAGKCIIQLANDANIMAKSGGVFMTQDLGEEYGITDIDGRHIASLRSIKNMLQQAGWTRMAMLTPGYLKLPYWVLALAGNKFNHLHSPVLDMSALKILQNNL